MSVNKQVAFATNKNGKRQPKDVISSVARAFAILELLADYPFGLLPKEVAYKLNIHISTCYHQLNTMEATGYVARDNDSARFCLTDKIQYVKPQPDTLSGAEVIGFLRSHLMELQQTSNESAYLSLWNGTDIYIADMALHPKNILVDQLNIGYSGGNHAMALGKVILSHLEKPLINDYIDRNPLISYTPNTITDADQLFEHLDHVSSSGYSTDQEESFEGVFCYGMPIFGADNQIIAAIGITTNESRFVKQDNLYLEMLSHHSTAATNAMYAFDCVSVSN